MKKWTGNNRAKWHDYTSKCIYHITLMKSPEMPPFGTLAGDCSLKPGTPGAPYIKASPLGQAELTRHVCLRLNTIAESIANNRY